MTIQEGSGERQKHQAAHLLVHAVRMQSGAADAAHPVDLQSAAAAAVGHAKHTAADI